MQQQENARILNDTCHRQDFSYPYIDIQILKISRETTELRKLVPETWFRSQLLCICCFSTNFQHFGDDSCIQNIRFLTSPI